MAEITAEMIREMESHLPYSITDKVDQWEWKAAFLNRAMKHPDVPCPCCGVTPNGDILDHLTPAQWAEMQPNASHHRQQKAERGTSGAFCCPSACDC